EFKKHNLFIKRCTLAKDFKVLLGGKLFMLEDIFSFQFVNWFSVLLAGLPALLNIAIAVYVKNNLPRNGATRLFFLLLLCVVSWQISDVLTRISITEQGAAFWDAALSTGWIYVAP